MIKLGPKDQALAGRAIAAIRAAVKAAHKPPAVARKIAAEAMKHRNKGRAAAIKAHPFRGICEASGAHLSKRDKVLDELEPEKGYLGKVRWVCPKANNSGLRSCGKC